MLLVLYAYPTRHAMYITCLLELDVSDLTACVGREMVVVQCVPQKASKLDAYLYAVVFYLK